MNKSEQIKKGITTIGPKGINFRSRLEARWAEFFTELGIEWDYEPIDLDGYIPDFIIKIPDDINNEILVEVKGITDFKKLIDHKDKIENSGWKSFYLIVGAKIWDSDDIKKYKKCRKLNDLFSWFSFHEDKKRLVLGIFGLPFPKFFNDKVIYETSDVDNHYMFIKYIGKKQDLYVIKDFKYSNIYEIYEKENIEFLLKDIKLMDVNEKISIELLNMEIDFEWHNKLCFIVPNDVNKKIIKDNYVLTFYNRYLEYNFINLHFKKYHYLYKNAYTDITEYDKYIDDLWISIQNKYQYKRKK